MRAGLLIAAGYLAGSLPFGVLLTRWLRGVDVRELGSGNLGATNVARVAGAKLGGLVLLLDALKGGLPVWLALATTPGAPGLHCAVGFAAVLGHVFPVWLRLRGGKGVATALGVLAVLTPVAALLGALVYAGLVLLLRVSSAGSLAGGLTALVAAFFTAASGEYAWLALLLFGLILWTHRANIHRLLRGREARL